ncbi:ABC transporter ATP-binding protein [Carnobacteriaceae bacterium zg-84]|uniref:ABC transporter ATP-binding protein n=1 Tax=Granulicatella sp. zg-84 TaxID=2678503 RepID=UPI0013C23FEA|nr:ABC transporter ATP-binding protein [Granulicatella sp. zg-84]NEW65988.1 ATP-binding cassette domain-containing protein [Granulicatella sp. zg-84]QMI85868.1 ABC transporter ATP-binding protein [Carnobacteriaceae bacterium zg-84]
MTQIWTHVSRYKRQLFFIFGLTILQVSASLYTPTILSTLVSEGILKQNNNQIYLQGTYMLIASLIDLVLSIWIGLKIGKFATGLAKDLRSDLFHHIQHFSTQDFQEFGTSSYINRTTTDVQTLSQTLGSAMRLALTAPLVFIGSIILSIRISLGLSIVLMVSIPILVVFVFLLVRAISKDFTKLRQFTDKMTQIVHEGLTGVRVIRAFNKDTFELERFNTINTNYKQLLFDINLKFSYIMPTMMIMINFSNLAIVWLGGQFIQNNSLDLGDLMAILQYSSLVLISLMLLSMVFIMIPQGIVSANRINSVLEQKPEQTFSNERKGLSSITHVQFDNVSFKYDGAEKKMLSNVSFEAKTGEKIAIIGSTGAGKSTLMNLLLRFLDATEGTITYNGTNIQDFEEVELRQQLALVPQNRNLFSGTIADNLRFGNENATEEEMISALKAAQAWEFVSKLDNTLYARVEQGGENFSGGQKQRLAIARALVKKASMFIFDDSFSALDAKTESQLRQSLKPINEQAIVFVVAQRISSVTDATKIIVLNEGNVVGIGTHDELAQSNTVYQEIMRSQSNFEEMEDVQHG